MALGAARHGHRVWKAGVELERRVARNVAVLAARVLQHLLHGGEGDDALRAILGARTRPAGSERQRDEQR
jgi:hypothetical protein